MSLETSKREHLPSPGQIFSSSLAVAFKATVVLGGCFLMEPSLLARLTELSTPINLSDPLTEGLIEW